MKKKSFPKTSLYHVSIFIVGFSSIITQIILMRELLVLFHGNELSIGIILFSWLICTALGSGPLSRLINVKEIGRIIPAFQGGFSLSLIATLFLIRAGRSFFNIIPGEVAGILPLLGITLTTLAPVCLLSGLLYTLICRAVYSKTGADQSISRVYLTDSAGAACGGLLFSTILITLFSTPINILIISGLNLLALLLLNSPQWPLQKGFRGIIIFTAGCLASLLLFTGASSIQRWYSNQGRGFGEQIASSHTPYSNITAFRLEEQVTFYENGVAAFSVPDRMHSEGSVHFTLLQHPAPKQVLLLGGTLTGSIAETVKHPSVKSIVYVERDPELIRMARRLLSREAAAVFDNPKVTVKFDDGRRFIQKTDKQFDVIINNCPPPSTARLNRFYTEEFFTEVKKILRPGGLFSVNIDVSENALSNEEAEYLSIITKTVSAVFPYHILLPGEPVRLIAAADENCLTDSSSLIIHTLKQREISTIYIRDYYIRDQLSHERKKYLKSRLVPVNDTQLNSDLKPAGSYSNIILWSTRSARTMTPLLKHLRDMRITGSAFLLIIITGGVIIFLRQKKAARQNAHFLPTTLSIFSVGFTEISLELILIMLFQVHFGSAYHQLALIIAGYMLGLMAGSIFIISVTRNTPAINLKTLFQQNQAAMTVYPLLLLFITVHPALILSIGSGVSETLLFGALAMGAGFIGGSQFPMANQIFLAGRHSVAKTASGLYSADLTGSALGALITGTFLIPLLGIPAVLLLLASLNLMTLVLLFPALYK